ncbi:MAG: glutathione S-transferase family protein [Pseudomonadota bacterium]
MPILRDDDIRTREVLDWEGIHLLHFMGSSCSQKTRIFLHLKGIKWESHHVNLPERENYTEWFMGINPRGLVPVLVDDGKVIIESNDILNYLENKFPEPPLIPADGNAEAQELLDTEDALHHDLRAISFRYFFPGVPPRPEELDQQYVKLGSGTVGGEADSHKEQELRFHREMREHGGISDDRVREAVANFKAAFDNLEHRLETSPYLLGDDVSLVDIAWFIYCVRLHGSGYPLEGMHPNLYRWFAALKARPELAKEVMEPPKIVELRTAMHHQQRSDNTTLANVAGL